MSKEVSKQRDGLFITIRFAMHQCVLLGEYAYVCACVSVYVYGKTCHACTTRGQRSLETGHLSQSLSTLFFETESFT